MPRIIRAFKRVTTCLSICAIPFVAAAQDAMPAKHLLTSDINQLLHGNVASNQGDIAASIPDAAVQNVPGSFCWWELGTSDKNAAKQFYTALFGWTASDVPMGPGMTYTMLQMDGKGVGGLYQLDEMSAPEGTPSHWMSFVATNSADATAQKVTASGGNVMLQPMDVKDIGRVAVFQDPTGAFFGVWQSRDDAGTGEMAALGGVCWNELMTKDVEAAGAFYNTVFNWSLDQQDAGGVTYTMLKNGENYTAGMMQMPAEFADVPSHWMVYFAVADCDALAAKAKELGATVVNPPTDIPNVGRFALIRDPQGAHFSIIKLAGM